MFMDLFYIVLGVVSGGFIIHRVIIFFLILRTLGEDDYE